MRSIVARSLLVLNTSGCARPPVPPREPAAIAAPRDTGNDAATPQRSQPTPFPDGALGTPHPTVPVAIDPQGRWMVLCQARADTDGDNAIEVISGFHGDFSGDALRPYLVVGSGAGEAIDTFVRASADGRWIAVVRGDHLLVRDIVRGDETDLSALGADPRDDGDPWRAHVALDFAPDSARLLYRHTAGAGTRIVVRALPSGDERELDPGAGLVVGARFIGAWVAVEMVPRDTDGDGRITAPRARTSLAPRECRGTPTSFSVVAGSGDRTVTRLLSSQSGAAIEVDAALFALRDAVVARDGGALEIVRADGTRSRLTPAACNALVLGWYEARASVLVTCDQPDARAFPLYVASERGLRQLSFTFPHRPDPNASEGRFALPATGVVVTIYPRTRTSRVTREGVRRLVDIERGDVSEIVGDIVASTPRQLLLQRSIGFTVYDLDTGRETEVALRPRDDEPTTTYGSVVLHGGEVVDLASARRIGSLVDAPVYVMGGHALVAASAQSWGVLRGPLRWVEIDR